MPEEITEPEKIEIERPAPGFYKRVDLQWTMAHFYKVTETQILHVNLTQNLIQITHYIPVSPFGLEEIGEGIFKATKATVLNRMDLI